MTTRILGYEPAPESADQEHGYRYVVDGEVIRYFNEDWQAKQYMDEDLANCQKLATESGAVLERIIYDDTGYKSEVLQRDTVRPRHISSRPRVDVNSPLSIKNMLKKGGL